MFEYYRIYNPYGTEAVAESRKLYPGLESFEQQLSQNKDALLAVL
jgi:hypothetical protein